jgi:hypothetical protein
MSRLQEEASCVPLARALGSGGGGGGGGEATIHLNTCSIVPETNLGMLGHRGDPVTEDVWSLLSLLSPGGRGIRSGANYHRLLTRYDDSLDTALMFGVCDGSADLTAVSPMCGHCRDKDDDPPHPVTIITTRSSIQGQETLTLSLRDVLWWHCTAVFKNTCKVYARWRRKWF